MAISISSVANSAGAVTPSRFAATVASQVVYDLDKNKDGSVDRVEFTRGLRANGVSADAANKQFDSIDTQKTGEIDEAAIESAIKGGKVDVAAPSAPPKRAEPPSRGAAKDDSAAKTYDAADTNRDGVVSAQEELIYRLANPGKVSIQEINAASIGSNVDQTA